MLLHPAAKSWSSAADHTPLSLSFAYEPHLLIWTHGCVQCCTYYACNRGRLLHHDTRALNFYPFAYKSAASRLLNSARSKSQKCRVYMSSQEKSILLESGVNGLLFPCALFQLLSDLWNMEETILSWEPTIKDTVPGVFSKNTFSLRLPLHSPKS